MYFTLTPTFSSTTSLIPLLSLSHQNPIFNFHSFPPKHHRRRQQIRRISFKSSSHKPPKPLPPPPPPTATKLPDSPIISNHQNQDDNRINTNTLIKYIAKPIVFTLFCLAIGFCPFRTGFQLQLPAIAAPLAGEVVSKRAKSKEKVVLKNKDHEYSDFTRRLLGTLAGLIRNIEEDRLGNGDLKAVEVALREVKLKKRELQEEIMNGLYAELRELKGEKEKLVKQSEEILDLVSKAKREQESLLRSGGDDGEEAKERIAKLEEEMESGEKEYNGIWEKVGEIEDRILRRETMALSIGVRELSFIERESVLLVENFKREMRRQSKER
ncbi:hypothetical protein CsSME_00042709 [Camellia sinensis var. sinensis]